jgi:hypothetical protein
MLNIFARGNEEGAQLSPPHWGFSISVWGVSSAREVLGAFRDRYLARSRYTPFAGSTRIRSPCLMKGGT